MWVLLDRLATLLHEATHPPQGGGFPDRAADALSDLVREHGRPYPRRPDDRPPGKVSALGGVR